MPNFQRKCNFGFKDIPELYTVSQETLQLEALANNSKQDAAAPSEPMAAAAEIALETDAHHEEGEEEKGEHDDEVPVGAGQDVD